VSTITTEKTAYEIQLEAVLSVLLDALDRQHGRDPFSFNVNEARDIARRYVPKRIDPNDEPAA
jgi:hypothetical protein